MTKVVKQKLRGRPKQNANSLTKQKILLQATALQQESGKVPSIRQLAAALQVDPMAIYYYFDNKNALLEALTLTLIEGIYQPQASELDQQSNHFWKGELTRLCESYLLLLQQNAGLLTTLLSMKTHGPAELFSQRFSLILRPLNLSQEHIEQALHLLVDYLHGFALAVSCNKTEDPLAMRVDDKVMAFFVEALAAKSTG
ncbi:TetR/AcrR family transcriptional regulator [Agarivorans sp. 1_MG-2023]|uniref:TetR/AcrR family transcriptional regulator n=1 Tax=Agarivorans sp. 1_MG-2023 TaxID=3062634 RepID=UPI0026E46924|nr:TetR/AcrR family transcriptional regulator [Agarivorans sp. 1_MG-2023]MDO6763104.1 TetR/AcrR family transcriptional regulator [Agarivorans sp. 1_MG-2023]